MIVDFLTSMDGGLLTIAFMGLMLAGPIAWNIYQGCRGKDGATPKCLE